MAATKSSSKKAPKAIKASKTSKASKSTHRTAVRAPVEVTKTLRARKPSAKARQSQQDRPQSVTPSSGTISPDEIPETDLDHPHGLHPRMADLERRLPEWETGKNDHLKGRRVTDRRRRRTRYSSDSDLSYDVEDEDEGPKRVSFTHLEGKRPFNALQSRYRLVNIKYFKQILYGTFDLGDLTKLGYGLANRASSDTLQDLKGVIHLIQCFGVYAMAIIYYAQPSAKLELTWALEEYRFRLIEYLYSYKFDSLKDYNYAFMKARISEGQEDTVAWRTDDHRCSIYLRLKTSPNEATKPSQGHGAKSTPPGYGICRNFNEGRCTRKHCKYSHICLNCQQDHPANTCHKAQTAASAANSTPLRNRVSRPE